MLAPGPSFDPQRAASAAADVAPATGMGIRTAAGIAHEVELAGRGRIAVQEFRGPEAAPTLMLLHGLAATGHLNWFTAIPALAERFHVLVVDHRGHGRGVRTHHFRLADCADDAMAVVEALGIESVVAVGYSMGGPIAKLCWSRHPDRVRGLVLCATANHFVRPEARGVASAVLPGMVVAARLAPGFFRNRIIDGMLQGIPTGEQRDRVRQELAGGDPATILQAARAVIRFSSRDWAANIDVPTAVVITTNDQLVPPRRQYRLAASIPGAKIFQVQGDHLACVRAADRFVPTLVRACGYVWERAAADAAPRRAGDGSSARGRTSPEASVRAPARELRIVLLGPPGCGKGTQGEVLAQRLGISAISTGDLLRRTMTEGSGLGKRIEGIVTSGGLVDDATMLALVRARLAAPDCGKGCLLDGYPRTVPQAEAFEALLRVDGRQLHAVVAITAPDEILVERLALRGRSDDRPEVIRERLRVYREATAPLIAWYGERGLLRTVDGNRPIDTVTADIVAALG